MDFVSEKDKLNHLFEEIIDLQQKKVLSMARRVVPYVTSEDVLQPNDYQDLENHPYFRYEEGYLNGLQAAQAAVFALLKEA